LNVFLFGLEIGPMVQIGPGFYLPHTVGVVIIAKRVGANVSVIGSNTIGMRNEWEFPEIGDAVFVGVGARILGPVNVGAGSKIGANAVVVDDVPPGATVVGIPARIVKSRNSKRERVQAG
jgi:serine O-acetyltransferase